MFLIRAILVSLINIALTNSLNQSNVYSGQEVYPQIQYKEIKSMFPARNTIEMVLNPYDPITKIASKFWSHLSKDKLQVPSNIVNRPTKYTTTTPKYGTPKKPHFSTTTQIPTNLGGGHGMHPGSGDAINNQGGGVNPPPNPQGMHPMQGGTPGQGQFPGQGGPPNQGQFPHGGHGPPNQGHGPQGQFPNQGPQGQGQFPNQRPPGFIIRSPTDVHHQYYYLIPGKIASVIYPDMSTQYISQDSSENEIRKVFIIHPGKKSRGRNTFSNVLKGQVPSQTSVNNLMQNKTLLESSKAPSEEYNFGMKQKDKDLTPEKGNHSTIAGKISKDNPKPCIPISSATMADFLEKNETTPFRSNLPEKEIIRLSSMHRIYGVLHKGHIKSNNPIDEQQKNSSNSNRVPSVLC